MNLPCIARFALIPCFSIAGGCISVPPSDTGTSQTEAGTDADADDTMQGSGTSSPQMSSSGVASSTLTDTTGDNPSETMSATGDTSTGGETNEVDCPEPWTVDLPAAPGDRFDVAELDGEIGVIWDDGQRFSLFDRDGQQIGVNETTNVCCLEGLPILSAIDGAFQAHFQASALSATPHALFRTTRLGPTKWSGFLRLEGPGGDDGVYRITPMKAGYAVAWRDEVTRISVAFVSPKAVAQPIGIADIGYSMLPEQVFPQADGSLIVVARSDFGSTDVLTFDSDLLLDERVRLSETPGRLVMDSRGTVLAKLESEQLIVGPFEDGAFTENPITIAEVVPETFSNLQTTGDLSHFAVQWTEELGKGSYQISVAHGTTEAMSVEELSAAAPTSRASLKELEYGYVVAYSEPAAKGETQVVIQTACWE